MQYENTIKNFISRSDQEQMHDSQNKANQYIRESFALRNKVNYERILIGYSNNFILQIGSNKNQNKTNMQQLLCPKTDTINFKTMNIF